MNSESIIGVLNKGHMPKSVYYSLYRSHQLKWCGQLVYRPLISIYSVLALVARDESNDVLKRVLSLKI